MVGKDQAHFISSPSSSTWHSACITHDGTAPLIYVGWSLKEQHLPIQLSIESWWVPDFSGIV